MESERERRKRAVDSTGLQLRPYALAHFDFLDSRYLRYYDDLVPRIRFKRHTHGSVQDEWVSEASEPTRATPVYEGEQTGKGRSMGEDVCSVKGTGLTVRLS